MGLIFADILLTNVRDDKLAPITVHLCIPESVALQLNLEEIERRQETIADGSTLSVPYVGPIKVSMGNRSCFTGAIVLGNQAFLGAIPMEDLDLEDMDLIARPNSRDFIPNPASPNMPASVAMGVRHPR